MENRFNRDEIIELRSNKYVKTVGSNTITYTNEFKEEYAKLLNQGYNCVDIFKELGFNPIIVGLNRIYSFNSRIKNCIKDNKSLKDQRTTNSGRKCKSYL